MCETSTPYDFELERVLKRVKARNASKILVQLPNGLKKYYPEIRWFLESRIKGLKVYLSASPCYGGCDVSECEAKRLNVDLILHYGHTRYYREGFPTLYIPAKSTLEVGRETCEELLDILKSREVKSVGLEATVQHVHQIFKVKSFLERRGVRVHVGKPEKKLQVTFKGQVIGCNYSTALKVNELVEAHLIICGGLFHPLGLGLTTRKPVIKVDPYRREVIDVTREVEKTLRVRYGKIMESLNVKRAGLILGVKPGQYRPRLARKLYKLASEKKVNIETVCMGEVNVEKLRNLSLDVETWIVTSCPRLPIDDLSSFEVPVLTPGEAYMVFRGEIEEYKFPYF